jgi:hypothetical protein
MKLTIVKIASLTIGLALSAIYYTGCSTAGATKPELLNAKRLSAFDYTHTNSPRYYRTAYDRATTEPDRQSARNQVLSDLMSTIDYNYHNYEIALRGDKTVKDTAADVVTLGLTAAATAAGGVEIKTILSAIATGVVGVNTSLDKNVFQNNTVQALQLEMRSLRAEREKILITGMGSTDKVYPLESGIRDVIAYYYDGTVTDALMGLVQTAGSGAQTNKAAANKARTDQMLPK